MNLIWLRIRGLWPENDEEKLRLDLPKHSEAVMKKVEATLCFPDVLKCCFACCPPIRPAGYEHIQYRGSLERILREDTLNFDAKADKISPITGFSCWALGYLDKSFRLVGCLLHPYQNSGIDLRHRIDYGEKCRRESCPEAKVFMDLDDGIKEFWLSLADGLDSFSYSSRTINPLFKMMGWGAELLSIIALNEKGLSFSRESFFQTYTFFATALNPRANAYLLKNLIGSKNADQLKTRPFRERFESFSAHLQIRLIKTPLSRHQGPYTHLLELDRDFLDFLRLSAGISKIDRTQALRLKGIVDQACQRFLVNWNPT